MAFSAQFLDELRARVGLADVISKRVKLTRRGREHLGLCLFHKEKTPSFTVNEEKGFYHCFGCQAHGSVIDFVMETENLSFPEAVERLAADVGMEIPCDTPEEREHHRKRQTLLGVMEMAAAHFEKTLRMPEGRAALDYLKGRGLDGTTISRFRLGFAPEGRGRLRDALARDGVTPAQMVATGLLIQPDDNNGERREVYDRFRRRVIFPILDRRGRPIAFGGRILGDGEPKYLNSPETPLFRKGCVLYNLNQAAAQARKADTIVVTEGYMDVIALDRVGFTHAVAPLGTALTEDQIQLLWRVVREPVLCFDGDEAGGRAAARAAERALPLLKPGYGLRFASLPTGEDPDSLIKCHGRKAMSKTIAEAVPLSEVLWRMETGGRLPKTPEAKATLQQRLKDYARTIQDPTVRSHFANSFNDRIWPKNRYGGSGAATWSPNMHLDAKAGPAAHIATQERREQIIIAVILNHPCLYDEIGERLGTVDFSTPKLDKLRQEVLKALAGNSVLESGDLKNHLNCCGLSDVLDVVLSAEVYNHAYFARPETAPEEARQGWEETFGQLRGKNLLTEIREAERNFAEAPTKEASQRLLILKRQQMDEAIGGPNFEGDNAQDPGDVTAPRAVHEQ